MDSKAEAKNLIDHWRAVNVLPERMIQDLTQALESRDKEIEMLKEELDTCDYYREDAQNEVRNMTKDIQSLKAEIKFMTSDEDYSRVCQQADDAEAERDALRDDIGKLYTKLEKVKEALKLFVKCQQHDYQSCPCHVTAEQALKELER